MEEKRKDIKIGIMRSNKLREKKNSVDYFLRNGSGIPDRIVFIAVIACIGGFCYALHIMFLDRASGWGIAANAALCILAIACFFAVAIMVGKLNTIIKNLIFWQYVYPAHLEHVVFSSHRSATNRILESFEKDVGYEVVRSAQRDINEYGDEMVKSLINDSELNMHIENL